jgi:hypothetical protein
VDVCFLRWIGWIKKALPELGSPGSGERRVRRDTK